MNSAPTERFRTSLHVYGIALSIATFLLLFAGGMVTSTNSGLSVPDWPTTFGRNMFLFPPSMMKGGIFYEHGHRLFASLVGFLTIGNCLGLWFLQKRRWLSWAGTFALLLVVVQGVLGGMTVRYKLPMPVSAAHACTAEIFFGLTLLMAFATSKAWSRAENPGFRWSIPEHSLTLAFTVAVFLQILVGAVMRHSYAGLAIPTFPMAYGRMIPPFWNFGILVHFLHTRVGAGILVVLGTCVIASVLASRRQSAMVKGLAVFLGFALALQCLLGMVTIWTGKAPVPTTFHLSVGALVFATGLLLFLSVCRLRGRVPDQRENGARQANPKRDSLHRDGVALT
jgi:cytochrome c oxidase assembly protein subunit 15